MADCDRDQWPRLAARLQQIRDAFVLSP